MGVEIERKFLVHTDRLPPLPAPMHFVQGYLSTSPTVRVRAIVHPDGSRSAELTVKGKGLVTRAEFNYAIPPEDAESLLALCGRVLRKQRHEVGRWVVDFFPSRGLWMAEIELSSADESFDLPEWAGDEVSGNPEYSNARMAEPP